MRRGWTTGGGAAAMALLLALTACGAGSSDSDDGGSAPVKADRYDQPAPGVQEQPGFQDYGVNPEVATTDDNTSTFALDVDTGAYTIVRNELQNGFLPDPAAVRTEEFVNYFRQDYATPQEGIGIHLDGASVPFLAAPDKRVLRVGLQAATVDEDGRQPANLTFVVDTSGSMEGPNLAMVQAGLGRLVGALRPDDRVAIVTFSTRSQLRLPMTPVAEDRAIRDAIAGLAPQDSTNLEAGLRLGYAHAQEHLRAEGINRVVLLSDGVANVGTTDPAALADQIAQAAGDATQLVVVGVGRQTYSDVVLEQFADRGNGFYAYVDTVREAERLFVHDLTGTIAAVALDAKVQVTFHPEAVSRFRLLGYENRQLDDDALRDDTADGGEIGAGHTVTALYELTLVEGAAPAGAAELATVDLRWTDPDGGGPVERSATLTAADLGRFAQASDRFRQDILVAAFAESLRGAPWSERVSPAQIADNARVLATVLPEDPDLVEFAELTRTAADLAGDLGG